VNHRRGPLCRDRRIDATAQEHAPGERRLGVRNVERVDRLLIERVVANLTRDPDDPEKRVAPIRRDLRADRAAVSARMVRSTRRLPADEASCASRGFVRRL
jgi:hypothetical protein